MALTITEKNRSVFGNKKIVIADIDFDTSYPTGGEGLTAANLGLTGVDFLQVSGKNGYIFEYDYSNAKLLAYTPTIVGAAHTHDFRIIGGTAAAGTDTLNVKALVLGKEEAADKVVAGADEATKGGVVASGAIVAAAATEVADTTNLSAVTGVRVMCIGW